jgi:hypothetical protein
MAHEHLTLAPVSTHLVEALQLTISLKPQDETQRTAQREIVAALRTALNARRQRIIISQSEVGPVKWAAILLMGLCTLIAIAVVAITGSLVPWRWHSLRQALPCRHC